MTLRIFLYAACLAMAACSEPTQTTDAEGSYGASSGPNANDPDATVSAHDANPTFDEPETATGSEFGDHMPSTPGPNEPAGATTAP